MPEVRGIVLTIGTPKAVLAGQAVEAHPVARWWGIAAAFTAAGCCHGFLPKSKRKPLGGIAGGSLRSLLVRAGCVVPVGPESALKSIKGPFTLDLFLQVKTVKPLGGSLAPLVLRFLLNRIQRNPYGARFTQTGHRPQPILLPH
jgi:hypothetical protein